MEFTYEGLVRHGFGFYNPNHAAALIVLLLPGIWLLGRLLQQWIPHRGGRISAYCVCLIAEVMLYVALIWTFSRAGAFALLVCAYLWLVLAGDPEGKRRWIWLRRGAMILLFVGLSLYAGAGQRFTATSGKTNVAASNRLDVWKGGMRMLADNPGGVGAEMSGRVYTLFYNPNEKTSYKTMVNSFLTIAVERGLLIAGLMATAIAMAMVGTYFLWRQKHEYACLFAAWLVILSGILISGNASTCFDWNILLNPIGNNYGELNDILQACLSGFVILIIFAGVLCGLIWSQRKRIIVLAGIMAGIVLTGVVYGGGKYLNTRSQSQRVKITYDAENIAWATPLPLDQSNRILVLCNGGDDIPEMVSFFRNRYSKASFQINIAPILRCPEVPDIEKNQPVILCGDNCGYANQFKPARLILYKPTSVIDGIKNLKTAYLSKWDASGILDDWKKHYPGNVVEIP